MKASFYDQKTQEHNSGWRFRKIINTSCVALFATNVTKPLQL